MERITALNYDELYVGANDVGRPVDGRMTTATFISSNCFVDAPLLVAALKL